MKRGFVSVVFGELNLDEVITCSAAEGFSWLARDICGPRAAS